MTGSISNLLRDLPPHGPDEAVQAVVSAGAVRVKRIVSHGHASPPEFWYDQPHHEWVVLLAGAARLGSDGEDRPVETRAGDHIAVPARTRHRVEWTTPVGLTVWLAVHYGF